MEGPVKRQANKDEKTYLLTKAEEITGTNVKCGSVLKHYWALLHLNKDVALKDEFSYSAFIESTGLRDYVNSELSRTVCNKHALFPYIILALPESTFKNIPQDTKDKLEKAGVTVPRFPNLKVTNAGIIDTLLSTDYTGLLAYLRTGREGSGKSGIPTKEELQRLPGIVSVSILQDATTVGIIDTKAIKELVGYFNAKCSFSFTRRSLLEVSSLALVGVSTSKTGAALEKALNTIIIRPARNQMKAQSFQLHQII